MILSQLRHLETVFNGAAIFNHAMDILDSCDDKLKREILQACPEIVDDSHHLEVAQKLKSLIASQPDLVVGFIRLGHRSRLLSPILVVFRFTCPGF